MAPLYPVTGSAGVAPAPFTVNIPTTASGPQLKWRSNMPKQDRNRLATLRAELLDHPVYSKVASIAGPCASLTAAST